MTSLAYHVVLLIDDKLEKSFQKTVHNVITWGTVITSLVVIAVVTSQNLTQYSRDSFLFFQLYLLLITLDEKLPYKLGPKEDRFDEECDARNSGKLILFVTSSVFLNVKQLQNSHKLLKNNASWFS